ncbi:MAG: OmpA family protein [Byssovorax sp.]
MALLATSGSALAEPGFALHVEGGAAHAVATSADMFGWGGALLVSPEIRLRPNAGLELPIGVLGLATNEDASAAYAHTSSGSALVAFGGLRVRPLLGLIGPVGDAIWIAGGAGVAETSGIWAPALNARVGGDLRLGSLSFGPFAGFVQLINLEGGARPDDGRFVTFGLHGSLELKIKSSAPPRRERAAEPPAQAEAPVQITELPPLPPAPAFGEAPPIIPPRARAPRELVAPIHFVFHRADMLPEDAPILAQAVAILRDHADLKVRISGHADEAGDNAYNLRLSELRAQAVTEALVRAGVDPRRLEIAYFGKARPLRREPTQRAQQENRRVQIEVIAGDPAAGAGGAR